MLLAAGDPAASATGLCCPFAIGEVGGKEREWSSHPEVVVQKETVLGEDTNKEPGFFHVD